jgi:tetratricopeptide (TPR) repeat protein
MTLFSRALLSALVVLLPLITSCTQVKRWMTSITAPGTPPPGADVSQPTDRVVSQAQNDIAAGAYQEAIDTFQAALRKEPRNRPLVNAYIDSLETMASRAAQAFQEQDFGLAGRLYAVLEKNYGGFEPYRKALSFSRADLADKLDECKRALYTSGLLAYRDGNLDRAIALWEDLLAIDPQNTGIQDALQTAKRQQRNLREAE